ncbi:formylglycine-generating enzyme family protein [Pseudomonadota bacterium]
MCIQVKTKRFYAIICTTICLALLSDSTNAALCSTDSKFINIPEGKFWMGSDRTERDHAYKIGSSSARQFRWYDNWELPRSKVNLQTYYIDRHLVTQKEYQRFVRETGHRVPYISKAGYLKQGYLVHPYSEVRKYLWTTNSESQQSSHPGPLANHPVVLVSQNDAKIFCRWRGQKYDLKYNLPDEPQWEKAARGINGQYYPWGNNFTADNLNFAYRQGGTTPVGQFSSGASPYGVMDMAGNVFEWTTTPFDRERISMKGGGSWDDQGGICRAASRHGRNPNARHILFGFRCSCVD